MKAKTFISTSVCETEKFARRFARLLHGGEIVFLRGPIGAGKTIFVKAIAKALGLKNSPTSASFSLMKRYHKGKCTLFHIDLFRLSNAEVFNLGFEEMLEEEKAIILAEWPDPLAKMLPADRLEMDFVLKGGNKRQISWNGFGPISCQIAEKLCQNK